MSPASNKYCTLFDSFYLTRGLALYRSLERTGEDFELIVYCFDEASHDLLQALRLERMRLVKLADFETPALLEVKKSRTRGEYCWTCTPHVIRDALERFGLSEVTYLDADLYFFQKPSVLLDELHAAGGSVLITEHRYTPKHDNSRTSGVYCVQFMTFKKDQRGMTALNWWADRCLEWCYARHEDGKFGDQKYLDDWTTRFEGVHVLRHLGGGVAPWNVQQYRVGPGPSVDGVPVVFYHFHNLRWLTSGRMDLCWGNYRLDGEVVRELYLPYVAELKASLEAVRKLFPAFDRGKHEPEAGFRPFLSRLKRRWEGSYRVAHA